MAREDLKAWKLISDQEKILCCDRIVELLEAYGVRTVFGMPGVHNLELYRALGRGSVRHVAVRHEQGAGFMADGFARAGGGIGVALTISGPGLTNISTALGQAWSDSIPILVLSSALARPDLGMSLGKLHELDQVRFAETISSAALALTDCQAFEQIHRAFVAFETNRPRPAHISIPMDVLASQSTLRITRRAVPRRPVPPPAAIQGAVQVLEASERLVIIVGGGAVDCGPEVIRVAETLNAPVVTTIAAKGVLPDDHPLTLGCTLQRSEVRSFIARADVILAIGTELAEPDVFVSAIAEAEGGGPAQIAGGVLSLARVVRIDIDPLMISRNLEAAVPLWGDAAGTLALIIEQIEQRQIAAGFAAEIEDLRARTLRSISDQEAVHQVVLDSLREALDDDAIVAADMTQLAYSGCILFKAKQARTWLFPNGFGALGYALPAAIGAKVACPNRQVVAIAGDCGFMFTLQELATAVELRLPIAILLWDNASLAEIRDYMRCRGIPELGVYPTNPDFIALAASFGCATEIVAEPAQLRDAVRRAFGRDVPTLIRVDEATAASWVTKSATTERASLLEPPSMFRNLKDH